MIEDPDFDRLLVSLLECLQDEGVSDMHQVSSVLGYAMAKIFDMSFEKFGREAAETERANWLATLEGCWRVTVGQPTEVN